MLRYKLYIILTLTVATLSFESCKKQDDFLNERPLLRYSAIQTVTDIQNLLQNERVFNSLASPVAGASSTDDYFLSDADYQTRSFEDQNIYTWAKTLYSAGSNQFDWSAPYNQIYYANTALDALNHMNIPVGQEVLASQLKGTALFYRSYAFYNLVQIYSMPYDSSTANQQLGIPLRLDADQNIKSTRASQEECYNRILTDLKAALELVPVATQFSSQPNKIACNAMLARVYLAMGKYNDAYHYADASLKLKSTLFDFNTIIPAPSFPGMADASKQYPLPEVIYQSTLNSGLITSNKRARVDTALLKQYEVNDIRTTAFFSTFWGYPTFMGSYEFRQYQIFDGLAVDEMYLTRSECNARLNRPDEAMKDLNTLLRNRYKKGTYTDRTAISADDALKQVLTERRKELCFRGTRWTDLRRLNKDSRFAVTLTRIVKGVTYTLPPNNPRYALQIPDNEIQLSGIQQNQR